MSCVRPNGGSDTTRIAVGHHEDEADENTNHFRPAKHGLEGHATGHQLRGRVDGEESDGENASQFGFRGARGLGNKGRERANASFVAFFLNELVEPNPRYGLTEGGDQADPNTRIALHENEPDEPDEHVARVPRADGTQGRQRRVHASAGHEVIVGRVLLDAHGCKPHPGEKAHEQQEGEQKDDFIGKAEHLQAPLFQRASAFSSISPVLAGKTRQFSRPPSSWSSSPTVVNTIAWSGVPMSEHRTTGTSSMDCCK